MCALEGQNLNISFKNCLDIGFYFDFGVQYSKEDKDEN